MNGAGTAVEIRTLIEAGSFAKAGRAFAALTSVVSPAMGGEAFVAAIELRNQASLLAGELASLDRDNARGLITRESYQIDRRRLVARLLGAADALDMLFAQPGIVAPVREPKVDLTPPNELRLEAITGRGNLQSPAWLERGLISARSVVRIITPHSLGSGFLLPGGRVMTNNHVLPNAADAVKTRIEANFQRDVNGDLLPTAIYPASSEGFFTLPAPYDCTVFRVTEADGCPPLATWGVLNLDERRIPDPGEPLNIVQHPDGGEKKIAVTANECLAIDVPRVTYLTDTKGGSSGSPVFDERWRVVALHRAGGRIVVTQAGRTVKANEGVLIASLIAQPGFAEALGR